MTRFRPGATFPPFRHARTAGQTGGPAISREPPPAGNGALARVPGVWAWLPPLIWAGLILAGSSIQDLQTQGGPAIRDKLAHFGEYCVFGWLVARSLRGRGWGSGRHFLWTLLLGVYLGALDEFYQGFVPGRDRDALDLLADVAGAAAGWYFSREDRAVGDAHRAPGNA